MKIIYILFGLIGLIILSTIIWRLLSRTSSFPCPAWLSWLVELDNPFAKSNHAQVIIEFLNLKPDMKILDAGCGPGRVTIPLAKTVGPRGEVTAMDIQQGMLEKVQKKAQEQNLHNIRYINGGIGEGKLEHNYYDRVILVAVLGEIPNRIVALQEIFNALKPGSILSVSELIFDPHFQRRSTVIELTKKIGFIEKKSIGNYFAYTIHFEKPLNN